VGRKRGDHLLRDSIKKGALVEEEKKVRDEEKSRSAGGKVAMNARKTPTVRLRKDHIARRGNVGLSHERSGRQGREEKVVEVPYGEGPTSTGLNKSEKNQGGQRNDPFVQGGIRQSRKTECTKYRAGGKSPGDEGRLGLIERRKRGSRRRSPECGMSARRKRRKHARFKTSTNRWPRHCLACNGKGRKKVELRRKWAGRARRILKEGMFPTRRARE